MGDACGRGALQHFDLRIVLFDQRLEPGLDVRPNSRIGEDQAVVTVNRALDAAGPGKGIIRAEENRLDVQ